MSAYIHFFIRIGDVFQPIYEESRAGMIYTYFEPFATWEKITPLTEKDISYTRTTVNEEILRVDQEVKEIDERCKLIGTFNNSMDEKLEAINAEMTTKEHYLKERKPGLEHAISFCNFLDDLIESASNLKYYDTKGAILVDPDNYIYVGIETGSYVTKGDIDEA